MTTAYHTDHAFAAPLTSAGVNSPLGELDAAIGRLHAAVYAADYGVVADGSTNNSAALAAAVAALPNARGTVILPHGQINFATGLDLSTLRSVALRGHGGINTGGLAGTTLMYTGTGTYAINLQNAFGCRIQDVAVLYNNAAFTGRVIDFRNVAGSDPAYGTIERCTVGGNGGAVGAVVGIDFDKATRMGVRDTLVQACQIGIRGKSVAGNYSNQVLIENCSFRDNVVVNIRNAGEGWTILSCQGNPLANGKAGFYDHDAGVTAKALVFDGCWMGDVTDAVNPSTQITMAGTGLNVRGCLIGGSVTSTGVSVDEASTGAIVEGNRISAHLVGIQWGAGLAHISSGNAHNSFASVTTPVANPIGRLFLPATAAALDGGTAATGGAVPDAYGAVKLADAATQGLYWTFGVPSDWDGGQLSIIPMWVPVATDAVAHTVRWSVSAISRPDTNVSMGAGGTVTTFTGGSAARTAGRLIFDTQTPIAVTPVRAGDLVRLNLRRIGADGADTYVGDVNLVGVTIAY